MHLYEFIDKLRINFQGVDKVNSPFFRTEIPNFVKFSTRLSRYSKSQYQMYGIAPSCVDVFVCCTFTHATSQVKINSYYRICDKLAIK